MQYVYMVYEHVKWEMTTVLAIYTEEASALEHINNITSSFDVQDDVTYECVEEPLHKSYQAGVNHMIDAVVDWRLAQQEQYPIVGDEDPKTLGDRLKAAMRLPAG